MSDYPYGAQNPQNPQTPQNPYQQPADQQPTQA